MYKTIFIYLFLVLSCANGVKNKTIQNTQQDDSSIKSKLDIIETVVNQPDVIQHSGIKVKDSKDVKYYIFENEISKSEYQGVKMKNGYELLVLNFTQKDSISNYRCYHFDEINIKNKSAFVRMFYPNGLIAMGNLNQKDGNWYLSNDFKVGFR